MYLCRVLHASMLARMELCACVWTVSACTSSMQVHILVSSTNMLQTAYMYTKYTCMMLSVLNVALLASLYIPDIAIQCIWHVYLNYYTFTPELSGWPLQSTVFNTASSIHRGSCTLLSTQLYLLHSAMLYLHHTFLSLAALCKLSHSTLHTHYKLAHCIVTHIKAGMQFKYVMM